MITIKSSGSFKNFSKFAKKVMKGDIYSRMDALGRAGVSALASATPVASGLSAAAWDYVIERTNTRWSITWTNNHLTKDGTPVVLLLQYGHGTGTGGYVQGQDFINPAIRDTMNKIAEGVWKEVTSA